MRTKIKWKMHALLALHFKIWGWFLWKFVKCQHQIIYFSLFLLAFISAYIIFPIFLEFNSITSDKKIFVKNFPFLTDSFKPLTKIALTTNWLHRVFIKWIENARNIQRKILLIITEPINYYYSQCVYSTLLPLHTGIVSFLKGTLMVQ